MTDLENDRLSMKPQHYENTIAVHLVQPKAWSNFTITHCQNEPY